LENIVMLGENRTGKIIVHLDVGWSSSLRLG
jgi:hypothetical protein